MASSVCDINEDFLHETRAPSAQYQSQKERLPHHEHTTSKLNVCSSKTPVNFYQTARWHISEDSTPHTHCCENFKSPIINSVVTTCYGLHMKLQNI
jgi:hypothetical protein